MLDEQRQQVEDLWLEPDELAVDTELVPLRVDLAIGEPILHATPQREFDGTHGMTRQRQGRGNAFSMPPHSACFPAKLLYICIRKSECNYTLEGRSVIGCNLARSP
jgi:hypothetical protein